jgi:rod shape-determining protein MreD
MSTLVKNIIRFILLILAQVFVFDKIHVNYLVTPYIYFLFILWMPFQFSKATQMLLAFFLGFTLDSFGHNPGFHAAACVLIAYVRPYLINLLIPQESGDINYNEPSIKSMGGFIPYTLYAGILTFLHNGWLFLLEAWQFGNIWYFIAKTMLSTIITLIIILITELLFNRKQQFRTNTM